MYRILEYTLLFVIVVLLQFFLFNNMNLGVFINPLVYIGFIVMLPMEIAPIILLLLGLMLGVAMDFTMGTAGINSAATLFVAFVRPQLLALTIGKDEVRDGGVPNWERVGMGKYLKYSTILIFLQCLIFFTLESMSWSYIHLTLLRVVLSTVVTVLLVYFIQMVFTIKRSGF